MSSLRTWQLIDGTIYGQPELSSEARMVASLMINLDALVTPSKEFYKGKNSGDSVGYKIQGRISGTQTTALTESDPVPFVKPPEYYVTASVARYAAATPWTGEREDLDRLDVEDSTIKGLTEYYARSHNALIKAELDSGRSFTYVPTAATTGAFLNDGTVAATAAAPFTLWHARNLGKELRKANMPPFDAKNWLLVGSPTLTTDILQDTGENGFVGVSKYDPKRVSGALDGEIGQLARFRVLEDNDALEDGIGSGSAYGSGYVGGHEAIQEVMVYPMHFRYSGDLGQDFGNQKGIAWQMLQTWKTTWNHTSHGQGSTCHITSA